MDELKDNLDRVNLWIGNCDQKANFLLAAVGVMATVICTSDLAGLVKSELVNPFVTYWADGVGEFSSFKFAITLFLVVGFGCLFTAIIFALLSLTATTNYEENKQNGMVENSLLHFSSIAKMSFEEYDKTNIDKDTDLKSQIYINSCICDAKFKRYKTSLTLTLIAMPLLAVAFVLFLFL